MYQAHRLHNGMFHIDTTKAFHDIDWRLLNSFIFQNMQCHNGNNYHAGLKIAIADVVDFCVTVAAR